MRVAITGASGVVGSALVKHLVEEGHQVRALVRSSPASALTDLGVEIQIGDLLDQDSLHTLASGCEVFFNVAGVNQLCVRDPWHMERVNVGGVRNVIAACRQVEVRRLVHTSSAVTLGEEEGTTGDENSAHRGSFLSHYERTKFLGEQVLFSESEGLEVVSVNPSSVQGPGRATGTGKIILDVVNGRLPFLVDSDVSMVDIDDCARGHLLAATRGTPGERYVLNGSTIPVRSALEMAGAAVGRELRPRFLPGWLVAAGVGVLEPLARALKANVPFCSEMIRVLRFGHRYDGSRATNELGLSYHPIDDTIERTIKWFGDEGLLTRTV